jgi:hypothetical protein
MSNDINEPIDRSGSITFQTPDDPAMNWFYWPLVRRLLH